MNIQKMMKQAQKMQKDLVKMQEEFALKEFSSSAGGGAIEVVASGDQKIKSIRIAPEVLKDDADMVQDLLLAAINSALTQVKEALDREMNSMSGGIPGLSGLF